MKDKCSFEPCTQDVRTRGLCNGHYQQDRKGQTLRPLRKTVRNKSSAERFQIHLEVAKTVGLTDKGCWEWQLSKDRDGYGVYHKAEKYETAHRESYRVHKGNIPEGLLVDHGVCHNPPCVNPDHLRLVTRKQNAENLKGATIRSKSGVRGVLWDSKRQLWFANVEHNGRNYTKKYFETVDEAEVVVIEMRNNLFTHNTLDRLPANIKVKGVDSWT